MQIDTAGIRYIESVEGKSNKTYKDSGGKLTIGIGHLLKKSELTSGKIWLKGDQYKPATFLKYVNGLTDAEVYRVLYQDLIPVESTINVSVKVPLNQNQYNALCSFVLNVGNDAFINSTLLKLLNEKKYQEVPTQMRRWVRDNGKIVKGLVNRREKDIQVWEGI